MRQRRDARQPHHREHRAEDDAARRRHQREHDGEGACRRGTDTALNAKRCLEFDFDVIERSLPYLFQEGMTSR